MKRDQIKGAFGWSATSHLLRKGGKALTGFSNRLNLQQLCTSIKTALCLGSVGQTSACSCENECHLISILI